MQGLLEQNEGMKRIYTDTLIKYLTELEDKNRKERRMWLNEQSIKLGRVSTLRQGTKVVDCWEEGESILKLQTRLREIQNENLVAIEGEPFTVMVTTNGRSLPTQVYMIYLPFEETVPPLPAIIHMICRDRLY